MIMKKKDSGSTLFYRVMQPIVRALFYIVFRPKVVGRENIPERGAYVLAGNHTKWLDPVMLVAVAGKRQIHFLAKEELFHGVTKIVAKGMGCIPVNRKIHDKNVLINAYNYLNSGNIVGVFPEGTINRTDSFVMPFKIGAVKMCKETGCLLVPFVIKGKYNIFSKHIEVEFLKPRKISSDLELENENFRQNVGRKLEEFYEYNKSVKTKKN